MRIKKKSTFQYEGEKKPLNVSEKESLLQKGMPIVLKVR